MRSGPPATLWPSTRPFMWFLSNCIIWSKATGRLRLAAPTPLTRKKEGKYLAGVYRAEMRSLTFLEERSCIAYIRPLLDNAGRSDNSAICVFSLPFAFDVVAPPPLPCLCKFTTSRYLEHLNCGSNVVLQESWVIRWF